MRKPLSPEQKARRADYLRAWRAANPEKTREQQQRYRDRNPDKVKAKNAQTVARLGPGYYREKHQSLKAEVIAAYGGKCDCCGETELTFLSLDHRDGGGNRERKAVGGGSRLWRNLRDQGWPQGKYRVLCMNCQLGWQHGRTCPHQLT